MHHLKTVYGNEFSRELSQMEAPGICQEPLFVCIRLSQSNRMALVRKADIEKMLAGNPYHKVLPGASSMKPSKKPSHSSSPISSKKDKNLIGESPMRFAEPLEYISGEDVMAIYKVKKSWLYTTAKRNYIPMCKISGKNYYSRKHMDALFGVTAEIEALTEWLTTEEAEALYSTTKESLRSQAYRHIPTKREYGKTYYSKIHLDDIFHPDLKANDAYYTTAEAAEKYGMTKSNICIIVKTNNLTKVKVGVQNLIVKEEIEKFMANRLAQFGSYRLGLGKGKPYSVELCINFIRTMFPDLCKDLDYSTLKNLRVTSTSDKIHIDLPGKDGISFYIPTKEL